MENGLKANRFKPFLLASHHGHPVLFGNFASGCGFGLPRLIPPANKP
jgi:hypothetical protein